ncbi:sterol desaturase family protein [Spongorhabdus nitratireducens]
MPIELIQLAFAPVFFLGIALEYFHQRKRYAIRDSLNNAFLAASYQGVEALSLLLLMPLFYWLYQFRLFDIALNWQTLLGAFLLQDFLYYWFHRCSHRVHWLWAAHVVHHSSDLMNFSTAFRQSLMYPVAGMWLFWTPMILVGFDPKIVIAIVATNLAFQFFVHTEYTRRIPVIDLIFNVPSHHRVHHATNPQYIDKNFAGVLIIWDRLFGTFEPEQQNEPCRYGIVGKMERKNLFNMIFHQWRFMFRKYHEAKGIRAKAWILFGPPSHEKA